jgi:hypothetical protein
MAAVIPDRMTVDFDGDFVVFLIGMRINKLWKVHKWLPAFLAMPRMLRELSKSGPESGFLGYTMGMPVMVQYWRSFEALESYARNPDREHWPAWTNFNKKMNRSRGDLGIWHETFLVRDGQFEAVYSGMPAFGLGKVGTLIPATGTRNNARDRMRRPDEAQSPALTSASPHVPNGSDND